MPSDPLTLSPWTGHALLVLAGHRQDPHPRDVLEAALIRMPPEEEALGMEIEEGEIVGLPTSSQCSSPR